MEEKIEDKRQNSGAIEYELWFQCQYPSLQSHVENAYTKWITFGEKQLVELHLAVLDTGSTGQVVVNEMIKIIKSPNRNISTVVKKLTSEANSKSNITKYMRAQLACISSKFESACEEFESLKGSAVESMISQSHAFSTYQFANLFDQSREDYIQGLVTERTKYQRRADRIQALMGDAGPYIGGLLDFSRRDDNWLQFEFNSKSESVKTDASAKFESVSSKWWGGFPTSSSGRNTKSK